ncbi:hypothetical protein FACS1894151_01140 [Spirochaetia bacterium]|nr:hypothetical protein FACS1894151_01140 [Spirochaetia bacterium]
METEHSILLKKMFNNIDSNIIKILDAGSGKTSLSILLDHYKKAVIDAIVFPGDHRKINSITEYIKSTNFTLMELDICNSTISKNYDLVLSHLLLGEALKWNNEVEYLLEKLMSIKSKYYIIFDYKEDIAINYEKIESYFINNSFEIICKDEIIKKEPQIFNDFIGKNYVAYAIKKK